MGLYAGAHIHSADWQLPRHEPLFGHAAQQVRTGGSGSDPEEHKHHRQEEEQIPSLHRQMLQEEKVIIIGGRRTGEGVETEIGVC